MMVRAMTSQHDSAAATAKASSAPTRKDTHRNIIAYTGDTMGFFTGMSFIPATTVLVGLASALTSDKALIGIIAMAWGVASLFPQLIAARLVQGKRRTKPTLMITSLIGRQTMLLFALWLLFTNAQSPLLTIGLMIAAIVVFNVFDSVTGIAWFDMLSRNLSPRGRGRILGTAQFLGSITGIGAGFVVARVLSPDGLPFPQNYAVVFICAWVGFFISFLFQFVYEENPAPERVRVGAQAGSFSSAVLDGLRTDAVYRRVLITRILTGLEVMAAAFYVVYIKERLKLPDTSIGIFSLAFIIGGILGIALFGWLAGRSGARSVVRAAAILQATAPLVAFLVAIIPGLETVPILAYALFALILAVDGAAARAYVLGFCGYTIDRAPEHRRSIYVGMLNTLSGLVGLSPVLAGLWLDAAAGATNAYPVMFGVVAVIAGAGALLSFTLPPSVHPED
jgi:MFS family permease